MATVMTADWKQRAAPLSTDGCSDELTRIALVLGFFVKAIHGSLLIGVAILSLCGCSTVQSRIRERRSAFEKLPPRQQELVIHGKVSEGMSADAVYMAWGRPDEITRGVNIIKSSLAASALANGTATFHGEDKTKALSPHFESLRSLTQQIESEIQQIRKKAPEITTAALAV